MDKNILCILVLTGKKLDNINNGMVKGGFTHYVEIMLLKNLTWKNSQTTNKL